MTREKADEDSRKILKLAPPIFVDHFVFYEQAPDSGPNIGYMGGKSEIVGWGQDW